jgi:lipopolysaccharide export system protein LptA
VEISWKEIRIKADKVHYFPKSEGQEERMLLEGQVLITEKNRELEVAKAMYYLDSETLDAEGITRGKFLIEEKE